MEIVIMGKFHTLAIAIGAIVSIAASPALAKKPPKTLPSPSLSINIDLSSQSMSVFDRGSQVGTFKVSTARAGYSTPRGSWRVQRMARVHWSKQYNAPLPHAIFFVGGVAIHATKGIHKLGTRASHGCVRLAPDHAAKLYSLVASHGMRNTLVTVSN
jgi:lipoprotein-anchoring transpeptidase ErfK/SrfK